MTGSVEPGAGKYQLYAAVIVAVLTGLAVGAFWRSKAPGGLLTGTDRRVSTSKVVVYMWTAIVAWMIATEVLVALHGDAMLKPTDGPRAAASFGAWMDHVFDAAKNNDLYLVFLGGPYAAAVLAGIVVSNRVENGTLQKTEAKGGPNPLDVFRNDEGAVDPVDFQYVLFNLLVGLAVVLAFHAHVEDGLPEVAQFLAILTGGSALTYTITKGVTSNAPALTAVHPQSARIGDKVTAYGTNLAVITDPGSGAKTAISVAGVSAIVDTVASDSVTFFLPAPAAGTSWRPGDRQAVRVTTPAGLTAELLNQLEVVSDQPVLVRLDPATLAVAGADDYAKLKIQLFGQFLETPGAVVGTSGATKIEVTDGGGVILATVDGALGPDHVEFTLPATLAIPAAGQTTTLKINVVRGSARGTTPLPLSVTGLEAPVLDDLDGVDVVEADADADLSAVRLKATGKGLTAARSTLGGASVVATNHAIPLQVQITDGQNTSVLLTTEPEGEAAITFLMTGLRAPAPATSEDWTIALVRGAGVSATRTLRVTGRPDPVITSLDPAEIAGAPRISLVDTPIHVAGTNLGLAPEPDRTLRVPTAIAVELELTDGATGNGATRDTTPTSLTFTLPKSVSMPTTEATIAVRVVRGERRSDPTPLTLKPQ